MADIQIPKEDFHIFYDALDRERLYISFLAQCHGKKDREFWEYCVERVAKLKFYYELFEGAGDESKLLTNSTRETNARRK